MQHKAYPLLRTLEYLAVIEVRIVKERVMFFFGVSLAVGIAALLAAQKLDIECNNDRHI
jgi:hypothetical protein